MSARLARALLVTAAVGAGAPAGAQTPGAQMTAVFIREGVLPIVLDGDLNDPAWSQATG